MARKIVIVVDSREKTPWYFPGHDIRLKSLQKYGCDYSVVGQLGFIGIERKAWSDYVRCLGAGWKGFLKQLERLKKNKYHCVIVEGGIMDPVPKRSSLNQMVINTQTSKLIAMGIPVIFGGTSFNSSVVAMRFMYESLKLIRAGE